MHNFISDFLNTKSNSDKITNHGYQRVYPWFLGHFKSAEINLLEIGVADSESLILWRNYFEKVNLFALDILPIQINDVDVKLFQVDQSDKKQLNQFVLNVDDFFDIIIDDGSHVPDHQMLTLETLWSKLRGGGVYIIEDIETSYWGKSFIYGYKFNSTNGNPIDYLKEAVNYLNFKFLPSSKKNSLNKSRFVELFKSIEFITFGHNCIILVKKDPAVFSEFYNEEYIRKSHINDRNFLNLLKLKLKYYWNYLTH